MKARIHKSSWFDLYPEEKLQIEQSFRKSGLSSHGSWLGETVEIKRFENGWVVTYDNVRLKFKWLTFNRENSNEKVSDHA
jgi:hypothetical protein